MLDILNTSYIYTDEGLLPSKDVTKKHYIIDSKSNLTKVGCNNIYPVIPELSYVFKDSIDDIEFILRCDEKILVSSITDLEVVEAKEIKEDSWLYHPWINRDFTYTFYTLDLSKYTSNHYDLDSIYLFNHKILQISDALDIEPYILKELLCREAAEYAEYLPAVKEYIEKLFCPYEEFLEFVSKNFIYKMPRHIAIDNTYAALITSFIKYSSGKSKVLSKTNCKATSYKTIFQYPTTKQFDCIVKDTKAFLNKYNIKFLEESDSNSRKLILYNKPLFELNSRVLSNTLGSFIRAPKDVIQTFIKYMRLDSYPVYGSVRLLLSIKEILAYNKNVAGLKLNAANIPCLELLEDDFESLESTLIIHEEGYFTKIVLKKLHSEVDNAADNMSLVLTDSKDMLTLSYTKVF